MYSTQQSIKKLVQYLKKKVVFQLTVFSFNLKYDSKNVPKWNINKYEKEEEEMKHIIFT